jgi:hypothetical protein
MLLMPDHRRAARSARPALTLARATRGEERLETGDPVVEAVR